MHFLKNIIGKTMNRVKGILVWGVVIIAVFASVSLPLYTFGEISEQPGESDTSDSGLDLEEIDAMITEQAQSIEQYYQEILLVSASLLEVEEKLQELHTLLYQATTVDETYEMQASIDELNNELNILTAQFETLSTQVYNANAQLELFKMLFRPYTSDTERQLADAAYQPYSSGLTDVSEYDTYIQEYEETYVTPLSYNNITESESELSPVHSIVPQIIIATVLIAIVIAGIVLVVIFNKNQKYRMSRLARCAVGLFIVAASIGTFAALNHARATITQQNNSSLTFALERGDMLRTTSASGVVRSSQVTNIFSTLNNPVQEIYVQVGDRVRVGDVLAQLDMSGLERDIEQAELNLRSAQLSATEEARTNQNVAVNAATALDAARISLSRQQLNTANALADLREAEGNMNEPFDSSLHDRIIEDAQLNVERRTLDVYNAERELLEHPGESVSVGTIADSRVARDRAVTAHMDAITELEEERRNHPDPFDDYTFQNAIRDAEVSLQRAREDEQAAQSNLSIAQDTYQDIMNDPFATANGLVVVTAQNNLHAAETQVTTAQRNIETSQTNLYRARSNLSRARSDHYRFTDEGRDELLSALESAVDRAREASDDAQRAYDRARDNSDDHLSRTRDNLSDAIRAYERALSDKERAIDDFMELNSSRLESNQRLHADSSVQLRTTENNVRSAYDTLEQAEARPVTSEITVDIQQFNRDRLYNQLADGLIVATVDGVITQINASVGASPGGVMFVIQDVDNLYISANVREHILGELYLGQQGYVTTIATGNREFDAEVTFISPTAVSPAGSTSVEFEVRATIDDMDADVRVGMNAFLNVTLDISRNTFSVPLSTIATNERGSFIYVFENGEMREVMVTIGLRTSTHAEIISNELHEGLNVFIRPINA